MPSPSCLQCIPNSLLYSPLTIPPSFLTSLFLNPFQQVFLFLHCLKFAFFVLRPRQMNMDGIGSNLKVLESSRRIRYCDGLLRVLGLILTLVAAILTGVDKETKTVTISITKTLPILHVPVTAKWHYMSAFVLPDIKCDSIFIRSSISGSIDVSSDIQRQDGHSSGGSRHDRDGVALVCKRGRHCCRGLRPIWQLACAVEEGVQYVWWILSPNDCCYNIIFGGIIDFLLAGSTGRSQPSQEIKVDDDGEPLEKKLDQPASTCVIYLGLDGVKFEASPATYWAEKLYTLFPRFKGRLEQPNLTGRRMVTEGTVHLSSPMVKGSQYTDENHSQKTETN
ncbi:hypothetical protein GQ457_06G029750 [Hibiscus cannabinus]